MNQIFNLFGYFEKVSFTITCIDLKNTYDKEKIMNGFPSEKPILEPIMRKFIDNINSLKGQPIYELPIEDARSLLVKVQDINAPTLPADIEDHTISLEERGEINIRIIRPKGNKSKLPAVMYFHGGGWILGDMDIYDRLVRETSSGVQAVVVFVDYDRSPEAQFPIAIEQAYAATEYISENGNDFNINSSKLAVMGDSVGGNMATVVAILAKERGGPKIDYQVLFYPVTDANFETKSYNQFATGYWLSTEAMKWFWNAYLPDKNERKHYTVSPLQASISKLNGLPPALVITNEYDVLRDEGEAYAHKLIEAGVKTTAVRLLGTVHDCVMLNALKDAPTVKAAIELANIKLHQAFNL